jgi:ABC-type multidrug transport system ATPase subunit
MSSSEGEIPPAQEARTFVPEQASKLQDEKLTAQDQTAGVEMSPLSAHDQRAHIAPEEHAVEALKRPTSDLPQLTIAYHNASVGLKLSKTASDVKTIVSPLVNLARTITGQSESRILWRIRNASGCIKPASMTMILAPPGHGKSSLLRLMCERLEPDTNDTTAGVRFNGHTVSEAADAGCNVRRLCHIVDQIDEHLPLLTVRETLDFAHQCTSLTQDPKRVPSVIKLLGLEECENTILGNALIRGVSGGQKRRVTVGEMLVGDARAIFLDEYTNGLDTATSEDITRGLRKWARDTNSSVVAAVQQPTPGLFEEFDDVIILNNADVIYHGPREDVVPFFASMGFNCPDDVDVCDFVVDCVSQPRVALQRLQHGERRAAKIAAAAGTPAPDYSAARQSTKGLLALAPSPCVSGQAMLDHYHASPFYHAVLRAVKPYYPSVQLPAAAVTAAAEPEPAPAPLLPSEHARAVYAMGYVQPLWTLLSMVAARQAKVFVRNKGMIMPRIFQAILMGLINGSLYYMVPESSFTLRVAILLICVAQTGTCSCFCLTDRLFYWFRRIVSFYAEFPDGITASVCRVSVALAFGRASAQLHYGDPASTCHHCVWPFFL